ncbi:Facilitated trehalose transporter Tret1 [Folsomia candida]|uniref:Facilitated trehalose transporter Tret1 n=1 Tax=Folsomia candida TaxID=158441 RepID=A0A226EUK4_FOLCA|nr:Facilitated trehalose transporter Tret1 [Folsomia candida]
MLYVIIIYIKSIWISLLSSSYMRWNHLAYLGAVLSLPFLFAMLCIPETPRWYIAKGKEEEAQKALQWLRGPSADIRTELNEIKNTHLLSTKYATKVKDLLGKTYLKPLLTSLGLMFFQQFSGINAVIFYTVNIFEMSGSSVDSNLATIIVGLVNIGATIGATLLIDRLGRKVLLIISDVFMFICLMSLGIFFYLKEYRPTTIEGLGFIPLISFMLFVVAFSLGFGPIPWLMMGEIFPGRIRGSAAATATAFNWSCTFIVTKSFPEFVAVFGGHSAFLCFALVCFVGLFFIIFCVPETQGKSLEDIERNLTRPFRRISSTANLKPLPMSM